MTERKISRSLTNYKSMHEETAKKNKVYNQFMNARTLTTARIILFGEKFKRETHKGKYIPDES